MSSPSAVPQRPTALKGVEAANWRECDGCGWKMAPYEPRTRVEGKMLCDRCVKGGKMAVKVAGCQIQKHAHDSGDGETIYHCPFCGSGQVIARSDRTIECEFCHIAFTVQVQPQFPAFPQTVNGQPVQVPGMPGQIGMGGAPVDPGMVDENGDVPPDQDGEQPGEEPADDGGEDEGGDAPPWAKESARSCVCGHTHAEHADQRVDPKMPCLSTRTTLDGHDACSCKGYQRRGAKESMLMTPEGVRLSVSDYRRRLAIRHAPDRGLMAQAVREER